MPGLVGVLSVLGMAVVAPLGLRRLATPGVARLAVVWPFLALLAGVGLLLSRGALAIALVVPYALACVAVTGLAALRFLRDRRLGTRDMVAGFACAALAVAATSLVVERAGVELLGFSLAIQGLTVAHFHYAAFAAVLVAGLTWQAAPGPLTTAGAWAVPVGTAVTFAGFFTGNAVELVGATVLTGGLLLTSYALLRLRPNAFLVVAALAIPATMALALWWAAGEAFGYGHPTLRQMAATHGVANALGVGLCGLLGWSRVRPPAL